MRAQAFALNLADIALRAQPVLDPFDAPVGGNAGAQIDRQSPFGGQARITGEAETQFTLPSLASVLARGRAALASASLA